MPPNPIRHTPGAKLFAIFVLVLLSVPKLNVKVGPLPIYAIDLLIVGLLVMAARLPPIPRYRRFGRTILVIFVLAMVSELFAVGLTGSLMETVYIMGRTALAFSVFFVTGQIVRSLRDVELVLHSVVLGLLVSASLMILTSLPMTRNTVTDLVLSHAILEPAAGDIVEMTSIMADQGARGRTLIGVSILGASFINVCWPLAALMLRWPWPSGRWRSLALVACLLAPMGVLMSYSRGPILGSILILLAAVLLGLGHVRRGIVLPVTVGVSIVMSIGIGSQIFFFDRLTARTEAMFQAPLSDERESERTLAYIEPFQHLASHPRFAIIGEGIAVRYTDGGGETSQSGQATHAVFAMAYYAYGMLAALLYLSLVFRALCYTGARALGPRRAVSTLLAQPLFLSVVALVPWVVFGHAAVSTPRGAMLFFFVLGLVAALAHFQAPARRRPPLDQVAHADRRHPAFG